MRKLRFRLRFAALAVVVLMLPMVACNDHDDPDNAEGVARVIGTTYTGTSKMVMPAEDVVAAVEVMIEDRSGNSSGFFNAVTFTSFTRDCGGFPATITNGVISTAFISVGSTGTIFFHLLTDAQKQTLPVGGGVSCLLHVDGQDLLGNPVSFDAIVVAIIET